MMTDAEFLEDTAEVLDDLEMPASARRLRALAATVRALTEMGDWVDDDDA